jgi:predicted PhzF superfamily epimerase YddE/YHI9
MLEMRVGTIPVYAHGDVWTLQANPPQHRAVAASRAELAAMLVLAESDVAPDPAAPPLWVDTGSEQLISTACLRRRRSPCCAASDLLLAHGHTGSGRWRTSSRPIRSATRPTAARAVVSRFFFPKHGAVVEDPGTGSACANLGGWLIATGAPAAAAARRRARRRGWAALQAWPRSDRDGKIRVSGRVIELARGAVKL